MIDEVYIKSALLYHGDTLLGKSVNHPDKLAKTMLAYMGKCLYGGPELLAKILPVCGLDVEFQLLQCQPIIDTIKKQPTGEMLVIIADGNRVNQSLFKKKNTVEGKPWLRTDNTILFDYVHVFKYIRNNWITEKCGEPKYEINGDVQIASDLNILYSLEKLNDVAISPKPIEKQRVSTCLRVFCDETIAAMETHPGINKDSAMGTINFLKLIVTFWKIVNVKGIGADSRFNDTLRTVMRFLDDPRLDFLIELADMADKMANTATKHIQHLTRDTGRALSHVCRGLADLTRNLLTCGNAYVILGWFTTDPLEKSCVRFIRKTTPVTKHKNRDVLFPVCYLFFDIYNHFTNGCLFQCCVASKYLLFTLFVCICLYIVFARSCGGGGGGGRQLLLLLLLMMVVVVVVVVGWW